MAKTDGMTMAIGMTIAGRVRSACKFLGWLEARHLLPPSFQAVGGRELGRLTIRVGHIPALSRLDLLKSRWNRDDSMMCANSKSTIRTPKTGEGSTFRKKYFLGGGTY